MIINIKLFLGLTVSFGKPDLNFLLGSIRSQLKRLEYGLNLRNRNLKFFLTAAVFDKPARAAVLNMVNSNGYFGCLKCLQKGERIQKQNINNNTSKIKILFLNKIFKVFLKNRLSILIHLLMIIPMVLNEIKIIINQIYLWRYRRKQNREELKGYVN